VSLEPCDGGLRPWRIPYDEAGLFATPGDLLVERASRPTGVRVRVRTEGDAAGLRLAPAAEPRTFDLVTGGELLQTKVLEPGATDVAFAAGDGGTRTLEIWLPPNSSCVLREVLVADGAAAAVAPDERPRWTAYGSSITQCSGAHSPARTWPGLAARARGLSLTCLGFGGNCHIETLVARVIRDVPSDLITLKLAINVYGGGTLNPRTFKIAVIGLVRLIREAQPDVPMGVISAIVSPARESTKNAVGFTLAAMRAEVADAVERLKAWGDRRVSYFDGLEMFPAEGVPALMPDGVHPNGDGYEVLGRNIADKVLPGLVAAAAR
jgi:lysophospholipase L1-like esterase